MGPSGAERLSSRIDPTQCREPSGADDASVATNWTMAMDDIRLRTHLLDGLSGRSSDETVKVDVFDGRVVLSGEVKTWFDRDEIERMAWATPDVRAVENCLTVHRGWRD
jgi:osmotically-inducible protein OsmY